MYDPTLIAGLLKKLSAAQKNAAESRSEVDFYLRLIASEAKVFGSGKVPDILNDDHRQTILALVRKISDETPAVVQLPVSNGKGASNGNH